jgi:hypothetical protein
MTMHQLSTYKDGYTRVAYCTVCGSEGEQLFVECVGIQPSEKQLNLFEQNDQKGVDSFKERK